MAKSKEQKRREADERQSKYDSQFGQPVQVSDEDRARQDAQDYAGHLRNAAQPIVLKTPRMVQRGTINRPFDGVKGRRISEVLDLDYMGSSQFEGNHLWRSNKTIQSHQSALKIDVHPDIKDDRNNALYVLHVLNDEQIVQYHEYLRRLRGIGPWIRTEESTYFDAKMLASTRALRCDVWWDIENHVIWSFDKKFMDAMRSILRNTWAYMDEKERSLKESS